MTLLKGKASVMGDIFPWWGSEIKKIFSSNTVNTYNLARSASLTFFNFSVFCILCLVLNLYKLVRVRFQCDLILFCINVLLYIISGWFKLFFCLTLDKTVYSAFFI